MNFRNLRGLAVWAALLALPHLVRAQAPPAAPPVPSGELDSLGNEAAGWLADLIRINTTNPPGNELAAAKYVAGVLQKEGITPEVIEVAPGRGIVIARLQSGAMPDPSRALMLVAHLDVVGVEADKWTVDPFAGVTKDGYIYGRGAIDDKGMLAANLAAFIELKRSGARLTRDVVFLATADEEQGGDASIKVVISKYWNKIACAYAINEGGVISVDGNKVQYIGVQASEKVPYNVTMVAEGTPGHASIPRPDNAITHLADALSKIGAYDAPAKPQTIVLRYFDGLAQWEDEDTAKWMRAIEQPERLQLAVRHLGDANPMWSAMLQNTVTPTMVQGGFRGNVTPSEASANLNVRLLPGETIQDLIAQLTKIVADPQIHFELAPDGGENAPPSSLDTPLYQLIVRDAQQDFPGAVVLPFLSTGATDSAELRLHNVQAYGLLPFPLSQDDQLRMHGTDERMPMASFHQGVGFLYHVVSEFARAQ